MRRLLTLVGTILVLAACSGDGSSGPAAIRSVVVSAPFTTVSVGGSAQLTATATDASGAVVPTATVSWATSAPAVATISPAGLVSAIGSGQTTITATAAGVSGSLLLTVTPNPSGSATVSMPGFSFSPFTTTIIVGGTVIYDFPALPHNVIFATAAGAPNDIQQTSNRSVSRTFLTAGDFPYDCTLHPGMSGVVVVAR